MIVLRCCVMKRKRREGKSKKALQDSAIQTQALRLYRYQINYENKYLNIRIVLHAAQALPCDTCPPAMQTAMQEHIEPLLK